MVNGQEVGQQQHSVKLDDGTLIPVSAADQQRLELLNAKSQLCQAKGEILQLEFNQYQQEIQSILGRAVEADKARQAAAQLSAGAGAAEGEAAEAGAPAQVASPLSLD